MRKDRQCGSFGKNAFIELQLGQTLDRACQRQFAGMKDARCRIREREPVVLAVTADRGNEPGVRRIIQISPGGNDADDLPLDQALRKGGVLNLLANSD